MHNTTGLKSLEEKRLELIKQLQQTYALADKIKKQIQIIYDELKKHETF